MKSVDIIEKALNSLVEHDKENAKLLIEKNIPHIYKEISVRKMTISEKLKIFMRDGFIDRYSGERLVFPNVLRLISHELPISFPYHTHWKMSECHEEYWYLIPTYDHVNPIALGGEDSEVNILTTSMKNNAIKSNWKLENIGYKVYGKGNLKEWDGLIQVYLDYININGVPDIDNSFMMWHKALLNNMEYYLEETNLD